MSKTKAMSAIRRAITRFDQATQSYAFKGSMHPDDHAAIEQEYARARQSLERMIEQRLKD